jgi:hypothetical protein
MTSPQPQQDAVDHGLVRGPQSWWGADAPDAAEAARPNADPAAEAARQGLLRPDPRH